MRWRLGSCGRQPSIVGRQPGRQHGSANTAPPPVGPPAGQVYVCRAPRDSEVDAIRTPAAHATAAGRSDPDARSAPDWVATPKPEQLTGCGAPLRVAAGGAPRRARRSSPVTDAFRPSTRWGCPRTGPAPKRSSSPAAERPCGWPRRSVGSVAVEQAAHARLRALTHVVGQRRARPTARHRPIVRWSPATSGAQRSQCAQCASMSAHAVASSSPSRYAEMFDRMAAHSGEGALTSPPVCVAASAARDAGASSRRPPTRP